MERNCLETMEIGNLKKLFHMAYIYIQIINQDKRKSSFISGFQDDRIFKQVKCESVIKRIDIS